MRPRSRSQATCHLATTPCHGGGRQASMPLIITPEWLGFPERMGQHRGWGLAGSSTACARAVLGNRRPDWSGDLAVWSAAEHQADFVLVNPLHASEPVPPIQPRPTYPVAAALPIPSPCDWNASRSTPCGAAQREEIDKIRIGSLDEIADSTQIDRDRSWNAKREALEIIFSVPRTPGREASFIGAEGAAWRDSPPGRRSRKSTAPVFRPGRPSCRLPSREPLRSSLLHMPQIDFHCWLQWLMEEQLAVAQQAAQRAGMALGGDARSAGGCEHQRRRCLELAGQLRNKRLSGLPAGSLQPDRAGLESAAVAPGSARRHRVRALSRDGLHHLAACRRPACRPCDRSVPPLVDSQGCIPRRAPTFATTTRP